MLKWISLVILNFFTSSFENAVKWEVEIYLLGTEAERPMPSRIEESNLPFIADSEILGYEVIQRHPNREATYSIVFSEAARDKLSKLDVPVCCGRHFVVAVNKSPIFDGYFWSTYSSYSCDFLVAEVSPLNNFKIRNGYPKEHSFGNLPDPRRDRRLLQAFSKTKRLLRI